MFGPAKLSTIVPDNWQQIHPNPNVVASVMEYHVNGIDNIPEEPIHNLTFPFNAAEHKMRAAVAEAVYALGWERNPNTVKLSCFAPMIQNIHVWRFVYMYLPLLLRIQLTKWNRHTPYLFLFDADPKNTVVSTSYHWQRLFALHHGTHSLPIRVEKGEGDTLFWHASINETRREVYFKIINASDEEQDLHLELDAAYASVNGTTMHAPTMSEAGDAISGGDEAEIEPLSIVGLQKRYEHSDGRFEWTVPAFSVSIIQFSLSE